MKKVQVLLSAYNGELYIVEQIRSILEQSWPGVSILIRDDGSSDGTVDIVKRIVNENPERIQLIEGDNLGVVGSFFELLEQADHEADFYCFCDQDDVWLPHKIESAVHRLESSTNPEKPAMVFTSTKLADSDLNSMGVWPQAPCRKPSFYNALYENVAIGATITFNKAAYELFANHKKPDSSRILMHDWWFYLLVSATGEVIYDHEPSMMYRQHGHNVVGGSNTPVGKLKGKIRSFQRHFGNKLLQKQAEEFNDIYGHILNREMKEQLDLFLSPRSRLTDRVHYLTRSRLYRQSRTENLLFKFLILFGYI